MIDDVVNSVIDHIRPGPCRLDWDSLMTSLDILEHFEEVFVLKRYFGLCVCVSCVRLCAECSSACECVYILVFTIIFIALRLSSHGKDLLTSVSQN